MIELKDLSVGYGKTKILENITATFKKGRLTVLIGVNGSGKTTLLKTIASIIPPFSGIINIDDEDVSRLTQKEVAKRIAYLPQSRSIPEMSAGELVLCGRFAHLSFPRVYSERDKSIAHEAMINMNVTPFADSPLSALSGGERQKVYIAMALAQESDYILLDEPTTYLDVAHKIELMTVLKALAENGKGVVAVLHDLSLALEFADEISLIHGGKIAQYSSAEEIICSNTLESAFGVRVIRTECDGSFLYNFVKQA